MYNVSFSVYIKGGRGSVRDWVNELRKYIGTMYYYLQHLGMLISLIPFLNPLFLAVMFCLISSSLGTEFGHQLYPSA